MTTLDRALTALDKGDHENALKMFKELISRDPKNAEIWSFYGICILKQKPIEGIAAIQKACDLSPSEPLWYFHLGTCLNQLKDFAKAQAPLQKAVKLSNFTPEYSLALSKTLLQLGKLRDAKNVLFDTTSRHDSPAAHYQHAKVAAALHDYSCAINAMQRAYKDSELPQADALLVAKWHIHVKQFSLAKSIVESVRATHPEHGYASILAANLATWEGNFDYAKTVLKQASETNPEDIDLIIEQLFISTKSDLSIYERGVNLEKNENIERKKHINLLFALAYAADQIEEYDQAWQFATKGNRLSKNGLEFDVKAMHQQLHNALQIYTQTSANNTQGIKNNQNLTQLYFLGTPRCGGSLIQTVLAAAPMVSSVGERGALLPYLIPMCAQENGLESFQERQLSLQRADNAGLRSTHPLSEIFVDKTTHNIHVAGLLHRVHPNAKFLHIQRNKNDTALSIYMRNFSASFPYSYDLEDIFKYIEFQAFAIDAWKDAGLPVISHDHDQFVESPNVRGRELFQALNIGWSDKYLEVEQRGATVDTFSALQVRKEIRPPAQKKWLAYSKYF